MYVVEHAASNVRRAGLWPLSRKVFEWRLLLETKASESYVCKIWVQGKTSHKEWYEFQPRRMLYTCDHSLIAEVVLRKCDWETSS